MIDWLIVLGFNDKSTFVGHFVSSPREREKKKGRRKIEEIVEEMKEMGQGRNENEWQWRNRRKKNSLPLPLPAARTAGIAQL